MEEEHIIRGNDPSFRSVTIRRGRSSCSREQHRRRGGVGEGGRRRCAFRVRTKGVVATGAQAKKQRESGRQKRRGDCGTPPPGGGRGERRRPERAARSAGSKGSYYNKFVGGLRSGNNSELRATLRMCLSLLLFKWKWKATSCNGRRPVSVSLLYSLSWPLLYLYGVSPLSLVGVAPVFPKWPTEAYEYGSAVMGHFCCRLIF